MVRGALEFRRTSDEATKHGLIVMAQSARALTKLAKRTRPVFANPWFSHLMRRSQYKQFYKDPEQYRRFFKLATMAYTQRKGAVLRYGNDRKALAKVPRVGLAKRSWLWGLRKLGRMGGAAGREIPGVVTTYTITTRGNPRQGSVVAGREMDNALAYIAKILSQNAPDWENIVARNATKIMMYNLMKRQAASVITTCTVAPALTSSRARSAAL
jgi:hypothetical protein